MLKRRQAPNNAVKMAQIKTSKQEQEQQRQKKEYKRAKCGNVDNFRQNMECWQKSTFLCGNVDNSGEN